MKKDKLTNEFLNSSDWDDVVGWHGNFTLGVGYCYVTELVDVFKQNHRNYHYFDVKWGRCGTTYLFSALRPQDIIVLTAWSNSAVLCEKTETLYRIWGEILNNLSSLNVSMKIFDVPAAWHKCLLFDEIGESKARTRISDRKKSYFSEVIEPCLKNNNVNYYDLSNMLSEDSLCLLENFNNSGKISSPWHLTKKTLDTIAQYFIDSTNNKGVDLVELLKMAEQTEKQRYETKNNSAN